jgi:hypothetical protein
VDGEAAVALTRRRARGGRRVRTAYRITGRGETRLRELLVGDGPAADEERAFALRFAFCHHLPGRDRLELLERRRVELGERLARVREAEPARTARYARSLVEHNTESIERDLEWVDELITSERRQLRPNAREGAAS